MSPFLAPDSVSLSLISASGYLQAGRVEEIRERRDPESPLVNRPGLSPLLLEDEHQVGQKQQ
jgi:hypothetical protein